MAQGRRVAALDLSGEHRAFGPLHVYPTRARGRRPVPSGARPAHAGHGDSGRRDTYSLGVWGGDPGGGGHGEQFMRPIAALRTLLSDWDHSRPGPLPVG